VARPGQPSLFSLRLRQARERAGLSQYELGVRAGLDANVAGPRINQYENGVHEPRQETILALADALGIPAAYLVTKDEDLARLLIAWSSLTPEKRAKYAEQAEAEAARATRTTARTTHSEPPAPKTPAQSRRKA
jgi:transcriptional regulator with XRE-family HTH domain